MKEANPTQNQTKAQTGARELVSGFSVLELLIAVSIFTVAGIAMITAFSFYIQAGVANTNRVQALYLLDEGLEAARFFRDDNYTLLYDLTRDTPYYLATSTEGWATSTSPVRYYDKYAITLTVQDVYRRTSDSDIVPSSSVDPKAIDPDTMRVEVDVAWGEGALLTTGTTSAFTYLSDLFSD